MYVWLVMLMFVFVKDCDLYGLVTKRVFSYLEAIQLASSCMLDHVRGSTISDGQILGFERHQYVCVHLTDSLRLKSFGCVPFVHFFENSL